MLSATNMNAVLLARFKSNPHYSTLKKKKKMQIIYGPSYEHCGQSILHYFPILCWTFYQCQLKLHKCMSIQLKCVDFFFLSLWDLSTLTLHTMNLLPVVTRWWVSKKIATVGSWTDYSSPQILSMTNTK